MTSKIIFVVDCFPGEESMSIAEISDKDFWLIDEVLQEIKRHHGYYPTGDYLVTLPSPEDLYSSFSGFELLDKMLPKPLHGFGRILEVMIIPGTPNTLYM